MTPVHQTVVYDEDAQTLDDCCRACFASILDLPLQMVPDFCGDLFDNRNDDANKIYDQRTNKWLHGLGYSLISIPIGPKLYEGWCGYFIEQGIGYHLISGLTKRDTYHMVVGENGSVVFDPHPDSTGLLPPTNKDPWVLDFILKRLT